MNMNNNSNMIKNFKYYSRLYYYRYFNPFIINHYNIINKLITYKTIGLSYYNKYPNAQSFVNLNKELFDSNSKAKEEWVISSTAQTQIEKSLINDIDIICKSFHKYEIGSEKFQSFYIENNYHIGQYIDSMIIDIKNDIIKNDIV